ncbi:hypothetical protein CHS0354_020081 [Potamilus streckersoni]|uniref:Mediator of RNA polymerase II transcription subunit 30 n=1 Tax=Potamilus streckersoni TaxID=2493646 RepID=A0AAE0SBY6_9BIVA|nr:hypothetical protein CHS0354_020081 [Potamilus streckersoni]
MATPGHGYQQSQISIITSQGQGSVVTSTLQGQMMASHGQGPIMTPQGQGTMVTSQGQIMHSSQLLSGSYGPIGGQQGQAYPGQPNPPMVSPSKSNPNAVSLCKLGQETVKELVQKMVEVFKYFQSTQLPNGLNNQIYQERRAKLDESLRTLNMMFRKLRVVYDKLVTNPDLPEPPEEHLIPFVDEPALEKNTNTDVYRYATEEHKQIVEQIRIRNRHIKEVIDKIRTIIWEINTMIIMRKTPEPNFS